MSAGKSISKKKGGTAGPTPVVRGDGGASSVPQEVSSKNRRAKLMSQNTDKGAAKDVHELNGGI